MKTTSPLLLLGLFMAFFYTAHASGPAVLPSGSMLHPNQWAFEKNLGQLSDQKGNLLPEIKYFGKYAGVQVYCANDRLSFVFLKNIGTKTASTSLQSRILKMPLFGKGTLVASRIDMAFDGANPNVKIVAGTKQEATANYSKTGRQTIALTNVPFFQTLYYIDLYHNIDMVVTANDKGLEYEFIVHPGGNVNDIKINRNGASKTGVLNDGGIHYQTAAGQMDEGSPQSFVNRKLINSRFIKNGNTTRFKTDAYDQTQDLVIDPSLVWSTYYGGDGYDAGTAIKTDASGNSFVCGFTSSTYGIATTGAYQDTLYGGFDFDAYVARFSPSGSLVWASYYGGDSSDYAIGLAIDASDNVYITGYTTSPDGIATKGAYQASLGDTGVFDAFLAKFNASGALQWGTYFGGVADDYGYGLATDGAGNAYMTGWTASTSGIATKGSHQTAPGGGGYDAYIAKFSGKGSLLWSTYFGGGSDDKGYSVATDNAKNVYLTGTTQSTNEIATGGAYKTTVDQLYGNTFIAAFDSTGKQSWGTYYGGANGGGGEAGLGIATNGKTDLYVTGFTTNSSGIATKGAFQTAFGGSSDAFLADFKLTGALNWGTYFGGSYDETGYGVSADTSGNIYITGYTASDTGIATAGAYEASLGGSVGSEPDGYLAKFNSNGVRKYATYFGGNGINYAYAVANNEAGDVVISGITNTASGLATPGAVQTSFGGYADAFFARFYFCSLTTSFAGPTTACAGTIATYGAAYHANSNYIWTVSGGSVVSGSGTDSVIVLWGKAGKGTVKEKEINSLIGCLDSESISVTINATPVPLISGSQLECINAVSSYHVPAATGAVYTWTVSNGSISSAPGRDSIVVVWPSTSGFANVAIKETSSGGCSSTDTMFVRIIVPNAKWTTTSHGKGSYGFNAADSSTGTAANYAWDFGDGASAKGFHASHKYTHDGAYTISLTVNNGAGCTSSFDSVIDATNTGINPTAPGMANGLNVYPNPFKGETEIHYSIDKQSHVEISVCDVLGRSLAEVENKTLEAGNYTTEINAKTYRMEPGIFILKITIDGNTQVQRIVNLKE